MSAFAFDEHKLADDFVASPERDLDVPGFVQEHTPRLYTVEHKIASRKKSRTRYAVMAVFAVVLIGGTQVAVALATTQESFVLNDKLREQRDLQWQQQALESEVVAFGSPQLLAQQAAANGLVVNGTPNYLRLSDGATIGTSAPAGFWSVVSPRNGSVANALIDTEPVAPDQAAWDAAMKAGTKPPVVTTITVPSVQQAPPVVEEMPVPEAQPVAEVQPVEEVASEQSVAPETAAEGENIGEQPAVSEDAAASEND